MSETPQEENLANVSLTNILASAVLLNENKLEIPIDIALADFGSKQLAVAYDEDRRMLILELVDMEVGQDESGRDSTESSSDSD